jgi:hypothetical protein
VIEACVSYGKEKDNPGNTKEGVSKRLLPVGEEESEVNDLSNFDYKGKISGNYFHISDGSIKA